MLPEVSHGVIPDTGGVAHGFNHVLRQPADFRRGRIGDLASALTEDRVLCNNIYQFSQGLKVFMANEDARPSQGFGHRRASVSDHRNPQVHTLHKRFAKPLMFAHRDVNIRKAIVCDQVSLGYVACKNDRSPKVQLLYQFTEPFGVSRHPGGAHQEEAGFRINPAAEIEQFDQVFLALVRYQASHKQQFHILFLVLPQQSGVGFQVIIGRI